MLLSVRFLLLSDIHLEFHKNVNRIIEKIPANPDKILVLAGDIGYPFCDAYSLFLQAMSRKHRKVFLVAGNHEYYSKEHTMEEINQRIHTLCKEMDNVSFLQNSWEDYEGCRWIGTTLWTIPSPSAKPISDVTQIKDFSLAKITALHQKAIHFLEREIPQHPCVVISHHVPSFRLIHPKYKTTEMAPYNSWFAASSLDPLFQNPNLKVWCYGHTHTPHDCIFDKIRFVCNPCGYPGENSVPVWNKLVEWK